MENDKKPEQNKIIHAFHTHNFLEMTTKEVMKQKSRLFLSLTDLVYQNEILI